MVQIAAGLLRQRKPLGEGIPEFRDAGSRCMGRSRSLRIRLAISKKKYIYIYIICILYLYRGIFKYFLVKGQCRGMESKLHISRIIHRYFPAFGSQPHQNDSRVVGLQGEIVAMMILDQVPGPECFLRTWYTMGAAPLFEIRKCGRQQHWQLRCWITPTSIRYQSFP